MNFLVLRHIDFAKRDRTEAATSYIDRRLGVPGYLGDSVIVVQATSTETTVAPVMSRIGRQAPTETVVDAAAAGRPGPRPTLVRASFERRCRRCESTRLGRVADPEMPAHRSVEAALSQELRPLWASLRPPLAVELLSDAVGVQEAGAFCPAPPASRVPPSPEVERDPAFCASISTASVKRAGGRSLHERNDVSRLPHPKQWNMPAGAHVKDGVVVEGRPSPEGAGCPRRSTCSPMISRDLHCVTYRFDIVLRIRTCHGFSLLRPTRARGPIVRAARTASRTSACQAEAETSVSEGSRRHAGARDHQRRPATRRGEHRAQGSQPRLVQGVDQGPPGAARCQYTGLTREGS